ncbi:oocyte zinc finger protein XlCOF6.1-like isoform X2 [Maniola jurtina]|uniref:oocyte zinc finger protein XlCOF6.1-like isoform X2 n=1 Tax=Maniola jurtina TaxID=191418 RepID=UPI001E688CE7|nr:oocyte zinc finger protein XlCOF6.1-like isoform X2 [Maniola jurtina]
MFHVSVVKDDNLPRSICKTCYNLIKKFSEFKKTCLQSQNTLLNYYSAALENRKPDWLNNDPREIDTQKDVSHKFEVKLETVIVKVEDIDANYDDFDSTELPIEVDVKVKENRSHKNAIVKTASGRKKIKCDLCSKCFVSQERFKVHKLAHETKKSLKCTPCEKTFITWSGLRRHNASCHERVSLKTLKCSTCGKIAKSRESLRMHEKAHRKRNLFICNVCGKGCTTSGVLKAHLETHKENRERHCTCDQCGKKFYTNKTLDSHIQKCHTGKRYICQVCSFPFTDKYNLAKHLLNHDGKGTVFKCEDCNKSYTSRTSYIEHQRMHSGERPFVCSYCSKSFTSKKRLTEHHRIHTGEKPHKCSVCEHSFAQRGTLNRHMKVHYRIVPAVNE